MTSDQILKNLPKKEFFPILESIQPYDFLLWFPENRAFEQEGSGHHNNQLNHHSVYASQSNYRACAECLVGLLEYGNFHLVDFGKHDPFQNSKLFKIRKSAMSQPISQRY